MEHIVRFDAGHDCINFECKYGSKKCVPDSGRTHGAHGLNITFIVKGIHGAVCFVIYTGWFPKFAKPSDINYRYVHNWNNVPTLPATLCYHSKKPLYDDQQITEYNCELCDGEPCYYDSSSLNSNDAMYSLVNAGDEALWNFLDEYYLSVFCNTKYPEPEEYQTKRRI